MQLTKNFKLGKNPHKDIPFIIKNFNIQLPLTEQSIVLYEFSLILEDLYQLPIHATDLCCLSMENIAAYLHKKLNISTKQEPKTQSKVCLVIGSGKKSKGVKPMQALSRKNKIILLNYTFPTWEKMYIHDCIICNLENAKKCIEYIKLYQKNSIKIDYIYTPINTYQPLAYTISHMLGIKSLLNK